MSTPQTVVPNMIWQLHRSWCKWLKVMGTREYFE